MFLCTPQGCFGGTKTNSHSDSRPERGGVNPVRFPGLSIRPQGLGPGIHPPPRPAVVIGFVALLEEVLGQMLGHEDGHVPEDIAC